MVGEWLDAMPQVRSQGGAEQVFAHLLIRSGLLLEPTPGAVVFVHRTFQDYLGAKAAVESRDFGVLVKNAHDDSWDDVVRMAVGHARPDERARLLRNLLKRADKVKGARDRLVLLAAACLEHAPELDPGVRAEIQSRTADLLPPSRFPQAEELARAGELVLDLLPGPADLTETEAAVTVRTAALVGGPQALGLIARFRTDTRPQVAVELADNWRRFHTADYVESVLAHAELTSTYVSVYTSEELAHLPMLAHARHISLRDGHWLPDAVINRPDLEGLTVHRDGQLTDLSPLTALQDLRYLGLYECPRIRDLAPLSGLPLRSLGLSRIAGGVSLAPLATLRSLTGFTLDFEADIAELTDLPLPSTLQSLALLKGALHVGLDGLERWPELELLTISGQRQALQLAAQQSVPALKLLQLNGMVVVPSMLARHQELTDLTLLMCTLGSGLEPLLELPHLTRLAVSYSAGPVDLSPLAAKDDLVVEVYGPNTLLGTELFPPERLRYMS